MNDLVRGGTRRASGPAPVPVRRARTALAEHRSLVPGRVTWRDAQD